MREVLSNKRDQVERLQGSVEHDEENVRRWHDTIYNLRPGPRADEIRHSLSQKISEVSDKIHSKRERIRELLAAIREIEEKL
jgi:chromosome segregation ATPase